MANNPYAASRARDVGPTPTRLSFRNLGRALLDFVTGYISGIIASILFTPVKLTLGGAPLCILYPILSPVGYPLFYFYLEGAYLPYSGAGLSYWTCFTIGLLPIAAELLTHLCGWRRARRWWALWFGFPIGFVGTLGVYYTAAASI